MTTIKTKREVIVEALRKIKGIGDFQIVAETEQVALKKSRVTKVPTPSKYEKITKIKLATVSLGNDYEKEVNARLIKEGKDDNFKSQGTYCVPLTRLEGGLKALAERLLNTIGLSMGDKLSKVIYKHKEKDQLYVRVYPTERLLNTFGLSMGDKLSKVIYKHKEKDQLYVRVYPNLAKAYESNSVYFDSEGNQLSKDEYEKIKEEYLSLDKKIGKGANVAEKFIDKIDLSQGGIEEKIIVNNYKIENILYLGDDEKNPINELTEEKLKLVA